MMEEMEMKLILPGDDGQPEFEVSILPMKVMDENDAMILAACLLLSNINFSGEPKSANQSILKSIILDK